METVAEGLEGLLEAVDAEEVATRLVPDVALDLAHGRIAALEKKVEDLDEKNKDMEHEMRSLRSALARVGDGAKMKRPFDSRDDSEDDASSRTTQMALDHVLGDLRWSHGVRRVG